MFPTSKNNIHSPFMPGPSGGISSAHSAHARGSTPSRQVESEPQLDDQTVSEIIRSLQSSQGEMAFCRWGGDKTKADGQNPRVERNLAYLQTAAGFNLLIRNGSPPLRKNMLASLILSLDSAHLCSQDPVQRAAQLRKIALLLKSIPCLNNDEKIVCRDKIHQILLINDPIAITNKEILGLLRLMHAELEKTAGTVELSQAWGGWKALWNTLPDNYPFPPTIPDQLLTTPVSSPRPRGAEYFPSILPRSGTGTALSSQAATIQVDPYLREIRRYVPQLPEEHLVALKNLGVPQLGALIGFMQINSAWTGAHLSTLQNFDVDQLHALMSFMKNNSEWTGVHLSMLQNFNVGQLGELKWFVQTNPQWTGAHLSSLQNFDVGQLRALMSFIQTNSEWTGVHLSTLQNFDQDQLGELRWIMQTNSEWTGAHLSTLQNFNVGQLGGLAGLASTDPVWTGKHLSTLQNFNLRQLHALMWFMQTIPAWTGDHLSILENFDEGQLAALPWFVNANPHWAAEHLSTLQRLDASQLNTLTWFVQHNVGWMTQHFPTLQKFDANQLKSLAELVQKKPEWTGAHLVALRKFSAHQLRKLWNLVQHHPVWTGEQLSALKEFEGDQLHRLRWIVSANSDWVKKNLNTLKELNFDADQLSGLVQLVKINPDWTGRNLAKLKSAGFDIDQLDGLAWVIEANSDWTEEHFSAFSGFNGFSLGGLAELVKVNATWTKNHLALLRNFNEDGLRGLVPFLEVYPDWIQENVDQLNNYQSALPYLHGLIEAGFWPVEQARAAFKGLTSQFPQASTLSDEQIQEYFLQQIHQSSNGHHTAAHALILGMGAVLDDKHNIKSYGFSRSTLNPETLFDFSLIDEIAGQWKEGDTLGVEVEMFYLELEGLSDTTALKALESKFSRYRFEYDGSLEPHTAFIEPIEMKTGILKTVSDIQRLQNDLSRLNDLGARTNDTAGLHIHVGIAQHKATAGPNSALDVAAWNHHQGNPKIPTPYQLLLMKQLLINMASQQDALFTVSRSSPYCVPNAPDDLKQRKQFIQQVGQAKNLKELIAVAQPDGSRDYNVNLQAFKKLGTVELRGLSKIPFTSMGIDPNIPLRDILLAQQLLRAAEAQVSAYLENNPSPGNPIRLSPSKGLDKVFDRYVQDIFLLEMIHALHQREPHRRLLTMQAIVQGKKNIKPETLRKIEKITASWPPEDALGRNFLAVLKGKKATLKSGNNMTPVRRNSLRAIASLVEAERRFNAAPDSKLQEWSQKLKKIMDCFPVQHSTRAAPPSAVSARAIPRL